MDDRRQDRPADETTEFHQPTLGEREQVGHYRIIQLVGAGGMGEVYEAEQQEPVRRRVALKLIKLGMDTRHVLARFETERQALALMNHSNIAHVFEAGTSEQGRPYFVMEYVAGPPITEYCDRGRLSIAKRLALFIQVCEGVQHAHQKGVIHRDLKPSNVLVAVQDDRPVPKIIDFGLAKAMGARLTDKSLFTRDAGLVGTPAFMSPEQADSEGLDVDTRTDVYALGVLLYTLLAGSMPFDPASSPSVEDTLRRIREEDPARPSVRVDTAGAGAGAIASNRRVGPTALVRQLRGDLDWIVMKAMEKDRTRRYASASELSADLERHLRHEPVGACPPSVEYRLRKFVRRHRWGMTAAGIAALLLVLGFAGTAAGLFRARRAEASARQAEAVARQEAGTAKEVSKFLESLFEVSDPGQARGNEVTAREILDRGGSRIVTDMQGEPLIQARLMGVMGRVYMRLGLYDAARPLLEQAVEINRSTLGESHPDVARSLNNLAILLRITGDYDGAIATSQQALSMADEVFDPLDPDLAYILNGLGLALRDKGNYVAARPVLERALDIRERIPHADPSDLTQSLTNLALLLTDMGHHAEALPLHERALEIDERILPANHPDIANDLNLLAILLQQAGDFTKSRSYYERALAIQSEVLGPTHPQLAVTLNNIAALYVDTGDPAGALPLYERALSICENALPPDHPYLASVLNNLANALQKTGGSARAASLQERALAILEKALGSDHPNVAVAARGLAVLRADAGSYAEAKTLFERALAIQERSLEPDSSEIAKTLTAYAELLRKMGRSTEAEALAERARLIAANPTAS